MTRADDLRAEFVRHQAFLDQNPATSFASQLVRDQLSSRLTEISDELTELAEARLHVRLVGAITDRHSLPAKLLALIMTRVSQTLTYVAWAARSGPAVSGDVPVAIERSAAAEVFALAAGSFTIGLRAVPAADADPAQEELAPGSDAFSGAVETLVRALAVAAAGEFGDEADEVAQELGTAGSKRLSLLLKTLAENDADVDIAWTRNDEERRVYVPTARAKGFADWLTEYVDSLSEFDVIGPLRILDTIHGRFGIEDPVTGRLIDGKAAPELLAGAEVDAGRYRARVQTRVREVGHTGATTETYTLLSLAPERS